MTSLEQLQQQWKNAEAKLDRVLAIESELLRQTVLKSTRQRVTRLALWPALDIVYAIAILLVSGAFLGDHWERWQLVAVASIVWLAGLALLIDSIATLMHVTTIDWTGRVSEIQAALARYRVGKIRQFKWVILCSPLVGFCGLIVGLQWMLERLPEPQFILEVIDPAWIVANFAFGILFIPCGYLALRRLAKHFKTHGRFQDMLDAISGSSVQRAEQDVAQWANLAEA